MYFRGRLTLDLAGRVIKLNPPRNFFGGVANLLTSGRWETREEMETYKLLSFAQSANRALMEIGVRDVARVSIGGDVVYEDLLNNPDDFDAAMQALQAKLSQGYEPDPHSEFDLVLKHDDGVLSYVIDLDFVRQHRFGMDPVAIVVTAIPSELRRLPGEDESIFRARVAAYFQDQESFDAMRERCEAQLTGFLNQIADHFRETLGVMEARIETRAVMPRHRDMTAMDTYTSFGYPLYGYDPGLDLAYLLLWDSLWADYPLRLSNVYYGDYGAPYIFIDNSGWDYGDATRYDMNAPAPMPVGDGSGWSDSGGGGPIGSAGDFVSASGGGGDISGADLSSSSDSGGGGWLSSIGDFVSDSGGGGTVDSGGGGDTGSSCGGGSSSCSSCGGGGCSS